MNNNDLHRVLFWKTGNAKKCIHFYTLNLGWYVIKRLFLSNFWNLFMLWPMNAIHAIRFQSTLKRAVAGMLTGAVLPKLSHPNRRCRRSASVTLQPHRRYTQNHRATCAGALEKSEFVLALTSTRHLWYNTLDKTTQHWTKHTVEFDDWQDLGTKNLIPNTCKSREAALSENFKIAFLIFVVSLN